MGLNAVLESERGDCIEEIADPKNILHRLLPLVESPSSQCLKYIDWYGDTVFNKLQMESFLKEWGQLYSKATSDEERKIIEAIQKLAERCQNGIHTYLKFYGD